jgi:ABC-type cobalamin/Fe3+-siderophores transport system ATPase subunit
MNVAALALTQVRVVADGRVILEIERLAVARGELLGVVGPNGAGKTTLLRLCQGTMRAARGCVGVLGQDLNTLGTLRRTQLRRRIGYVPQSAPAHSTLPLTVREVVAIGRTGRAGLLRRLSRHDWEVIDDWLAQLGLRPFAAARYATLSGGEQRKALLAKALVQEPELLLLDEPTTHLDVAWREQFVALLGQIHAALRPSVVLVTHELEALPPACERVLLLDQGRVLADGPRARVLDAARIAALYGPGLRVLHANGRSTLVPAAIEAGAAAVAPTAIVAGAGEAG